VSPTLPALRDRIESLADDDGRYCVACARTGVSPVSVSGLRYADRKTAARAARLTRAYRARLRRFDPAVAYHDLVVHEETTAVRATLSNPHAAAPSGDPID
jgi:hypothetical protein